MVEFRIKVHPTQRIAYFPREITEALGYDLRATADRVTMVLWPKNARLEDVVKSLRIVLADLEHALELERMRHAHNSVISQPSADHF